MHDTGQVGRPACTLPGDIHLNAGFYAAPWVIDVGQDGNGGRFLVTDSVMTFDDGRVHLHDDATYETAGGGARVALDRVVVEGGNARHVIGANTISRFGYIDVNRDDFTIDFAGGTMIAGAVNLATDVDALTFEGTRNAGLPTSAVHLWASGSTNPADPQTLSFVDVTRSMDLYLPILLGNTELVFDNSNVFVRTAPTLAGANNSPVLHPGAGVQMYPGITLTSGADPLTNHVEDPSGAPTPATATLTLNKAQDLGTDFRFDVIGNAPFSLELANPLTTTLIPIAARGDVTIPGQGTQLRMGLLTDLRPGDFCPDPGCSRQPVARFGALDVEGQVQVGDLSQVTFNLGRASGVLASDVLRYGDNAAAATSDVSHATFALPPLGVTSARDPDGRSFVLIDRAAGTSGTMNSPFSSYIEAYQLAIDPTTPAVRRFSVLEDPANDGRLVIGTTTDASLILQKATGGRNHRALVAGLATTPITTTVTSPLLSTGTSLATAIASLTNTQLGSLSNLHLEPYSSFLTVGLEQTDVVFDLVMNHASGTAFALAPDVQSASRSLGRDGRAAPTGQEPRLPNTWGNLGMARGNVIGRLDLGSFELALSGIAVGHDFLRTPETTFGAYFGYGTSQLTEHDIVSQTLEAQHYHFGVHGEQRLASGWEISGAAGVVASNVQSRRFAPDVGLFTGGTARDSFSTYGVYAGAMVARDLPISRSTTIPPSAGHVYGLVQHGAVQETGANDFNFSIAPARAAALTATLGLDVEHRFGHGKLDWALKGFARYRYDALADSRPEHQVVASNPYFGTFTQFGQNRGAHNMTAGIGINGHLNEMMTVGVGAARSWASHGTENSITASLSITW